MAFLIHAVGWGVMMSACGTSVPRVITGFCGGMLISLGFAMRKK